MTKKKNPLSLGTTRVEFVFPGEHFVGRIHFRSATNKERTQRRQVFGFAGQFFESCLVESDLNRSHLSSNHGET